MPTSSLKQYSSTSLAQGLYCLDTISQDGVFCLLYIPIDLVEYHHSSVVKLSGLWTADQDPIESSDPPEVFVNIYVTLKV